MPASPIGMRRSCSNLTDLSLLPGCTVSLTGLAPFNGPLSVRTDSGEHAIGREVAASIFVA